MSTTRRSRLRKLGVMSLVSGCVGLGLALATSTPAVADVNTVSGSATALSIGGTPVTPQVSGSATAPATGYGPIGTGELPSGVDCATGIVPTLPAVGLAINVALLEACTRGGDVGTHQGFAESQARTVDLEIGTTDLGVITSACVADGDDAVGTTTIIGSPVLPENPAPGQVVQAPLQILPAPLPPTLLTVTLNEQIVTSTPPVGTTAGVNDITVNALRLSVLGIDIIVGQSHCRAEGPDVNATTLPPTTAPPTTAPPTTAPPTTPTTVVAPPNNNTNNNDNTNNNNSDNTNTNTNNNTQNQTNNQTQAGGDNTNINENTITILGSTFDDFHRRGKFSNEDHEGGATFGKALARTGLDSSRLTGLALLLLLFGGLLVLGTRTVTAEAVAIPGARRRRSVRSVFSPSRRWR